CRPGVHRRPRNAALCGQEQRILFGNEPVQPSQQGQHDAGRGYQLHQETVTYGSRITDHVFSMSTIEMIWLTIGFLGQGIFFMRWVVQWVASERSAASHVPIAFWYTSLIGGLITLAYPIYRRDPVCLAG